MDGLSSVDWLIRLMGSVGLQVKVWVGLVCPVRMAGLVDLEEKTLLGQPDIALTNSRLKPTILLLPPLLYRFAIASMAGLQGEVFGRYGGQSRFAGISSVDRHSALLQVSIQSLRVRIPFE
ncbi:hypothetical protein Nepgr_033680 [Nepenthes gracilis]|uniref:Uncharacterized protein n=1 Tax=Nepenthes gracilis TaxID=150966 RepID=A0AAD3TMD9_NEPGR|nr:hypothetical protein Nepgr_033680 [Nepenthes gracilis]